MIFRVILISIGLIGIACFGCNRHSTSSSNIPPLPPLPSWEAVGEKTVHKTRLLQADVKKIADKASISLGINISEYVFKGMLYSPDTQKWAVQYDSSLSTCVGCHFSIIVNDKDDSTTIIRGQ